MFQCDAMSFYFAPSRYIFRTLQRSSVIAKKSNIIVIVDIVAIAIFTIVIVAIVIVAKRVKLLDWRVVFKMYSGLVCQPLPLS